MRAYTQSGPGGRPGGYACHARTQRDGNAVVSVALCASGSKTVTFSETRS
jgi:hypothetical protein